MTRLPLAAAASAAALILALGGSAQAIIVFDPSNYGQNLLTAARELQQVNNQITSLQRQAQSLVNQGRNLASLPYSSLQSLQQSIQRTQALLGQAQRIAYDVQAIEKAFGGAGGAYAPATASASSKALVANAQSRWRTSVAALQDALKIQATVVGNLNTNRTQMTALVGASQGATGALQASQAGNQLLALQAQQLADLTAAVAAQGRAQALESAQRAAAQDQAHEQLSRFLTPGGAYQPTDIILFH